MSKRFEKRLYDLMKESMVVDFKTKNERLVQVAFVCGCRVKRDKYFSSVHLPCKRGK